MASRLLWDVNADVDALLTQFCDKAYGKAGDTLRRYYMFWENAIQTSNIHAADNMSEACLKVFTPANLATASEMLGEASRLADSSKARQRVERVAAHIEYTALVSKYAHALKAVRDRHPINWLWEQDAATKDEIEEQAVPIISEIHAFFEANQDARVVRFRNNNYIDRFLNPAYAMSLVDSIGSDPDAGPLTADTWLARPGATQLARRPGLPKQIDLWVYGYDFDVDHSGSEHDLFVVSAEGRRRLVAKLAPPSESGNREVRCYVVPDIDTGDLDPASVRLVLTNHPGGRTSSTVLAYYLMPHMPKLTNQQATALVREHRDRVRAASGGFIEYPRRGLRNDDGAQEEITIPVIGLPEPPPSFGVR